MKNKKILFIIGGIIVLGLLIAGAIIFVVPRFIYIKSINIKEKEVKLYVGDTYDVVYTINPSNAYNKNVLIKVKNKKVIDSTGNKLKAINPGETEVCIISEENKKISSCFDVSITTKREEFLNKLENKGWKRQDNGTYTSGNITFDLTNYTYTIYQDQDGIKARYTYHYVTNTIDGEADCGNNISAKYFYNGKTRTLSCVGSTPLVHQYLCSSTNQSITTNLFDTIIESANVTLGDFTIDDLDY